LGIEGDESIIKMEHKEVHWFIAVFRCWPWFWWCVSPHMRMAGGSLA